MVSLSSDIGQRRLTLADKFRGVQWGLVIVVAAISGIGFAMLYSAANGSLQPWASRQMIRFAIAFVPIEASAMCENERMIAPSPTLTPGPNTTNGSTVTSLPNLVSAAR